MTGVLIGTMVYLICAGDSTSLDVDPNNLQKGARILTYNHHGGPNQKWVGKINDNRRGMIFDGTIASFMNENLCVDADYNNHNNAHLYTRNGSKNQLWETTLVEWQDGAYMNYGYHICSVFHGLCLRSSGSNRPVTLVPQNSSDLYQLWKPAVDIGLPLP